MIRRPPRSTLSSSSAASDVYKRQVLGLYYLTKARPGAKGEGRTFASTDDVLIALEMGEVETLTPIKLRYTGRVIDLVHAFDTQNIIHTEPIEFIKQ